MNVQIINKDQQKFVFRGIIFKLITCTLPPQVEILSIDRDDIENLYYLLPTKFKQCQFISPDLPKECHVDVNKHQSIFFWMLNTLPICCGCYPVILTDSEKIDLYNFIETSMDTTIDYTDMYGRPIQPFQRKSFEELLDIVVNNSDLTKEEVKERVDNKIVDLGGLCIKECAIIIIARELNISNSVFK
jgi:hypothetical protein